MPRGVARGLAWYGPWPPMSMLFSCALLEAAVSSTDAPPEGALAPGAEVVVENGPPSGSCSCSSSVRYL